MVFSSWIVETKLICCKLHASIVLVASLLKQPICRLWSDVVSRLQVKKIETGKLWHSALYEKITFFFSHRFLSVMAMYMGWLWKCSIICFSCARDGEYLVTGITATVRPWANQKTTSLVKDLYSSDHWFFSNIHFSPWFFNSSGGFHCKDVTTL